MNEQLISKLFKYDGANLYWRRPGRNRKLNKPAGSLDFYGYRIIRFESKNYKAHRLIFLLHHGYLPEQLDHINGDKQDNRINNLRCATASQNSCNRKSKGYSKSNNPNYKWKSAIEVDGKYIHLGYFNNKLHAIAAYKKAALQYHGEYANA